LRQVWQDCSEALILVKRDTVISWIAPATTILGLAVLRMRSGRAGRNWQKKSGS